MTKQTEALKLIQEHIDMQQYQHAWDKCQELIEQPAQEPYDLVAILNDPMQAYPANFTTAKKGNALLFGLCQEAADEIQRLQHKTLEQEPVAWVKDNLICPENNYETTRTEEHPKDLGWTPLYSHPAPQPAQEPVAWRSEGGVLTEAKLQAQSWVSHGGKAIPLYTHPAPSWQGLSDDEILEIDKSIDPEISIGKGKTLFARAIEQALKEKNA